MAVSITSQLVHKALQNHTTTEFLAPHKYKDVKSALIKYNLNPNHPQMASYTAKFIPNNFFKKARAVFQLSWDQKKLYNASFYQSAALTTTLFVIGLLGIRYLPEKYRQFLEKEQKRFAELAKGKYIITNGVRRAATAADYMPNYRRRIILAVSLYVLALLRCAYQTNYHLKNKPICKYSISFTDRSITLDALADSIKTVLRNKYFHGNNSLNTDTWNVFQIHTSEFNNCWDDCKVSKNEKQALLNKPRFVTPLQPTLDDIDKVYQRAINLEKISEGNDKQMDTLLKRLNAYDNINLKWLPDHDEETMSEPKAPNPQENTSELYKKTQQHFYEQSIRSLKKREKRINSLRIYQPWINRTISEFESVLINDYFCAFLYSSHINPIKFTNPLWPTLEYKKESPWLYLGFLKKVLRVVQAENQEEKTDWVINKLNELINIIEPMVKDEINAAKAQAKNHSLKQFSKTSEFEAAVAELEYQKRLQNFTKLVPEAKEFLNC